MKQYLDMVEHILSHGAKRTDRTGVGTISVFGYQFRHDLSRGFPLLTTKKMFWKGILYELFWMICGDTNIKYLQDNGVHIWDEWAKEDGDLGPVYGKQWRAWEGTPSGTVYGDGSGKEFKGYEITRPKIDQLQEAIDTIRNDPDSRRIIVSAWNAAEIADMKLPPCHALFQFYVHDGKLSCHMYQRSADAFLGVPFNIAQYALLTHLVAHATHLSVGDLIISYGDLHIYQNHVDQVKEQLTRTPMALPSLSVNGAAERSIDALKPEDVELMFYHSYPALKGEVAV